MSVLTKSLHPDEKIKAGKLGSNLVKVGALLAVAFLGLSVILVLAGSDTAALEAGHHSKWSRFLHSYVVGWSFIVGVPIGMLWLVLLHHLVRGRWVTVVRRICEAITGSFALVWLAGLVFVIPVATGYGDLYYWNNDAAKDVALNGVLQHKLGWLSGGFFALRYIVYGAFYIGISAYFTKKSKEQDESGDPKISDHLRVVSGPGMIFFGFVTCLVGFDVLMSFAPKWYSTIYGVGFWGSACIGGFATLALIVLWIQRSGRLTHSVTEEHYHDIGKWLFSFTFFWAYTAFSQFMLQWYGNMPEETVWYKYRLFGDWQWVSIAILAGYWAFPFVFLLSRWTKRIMPALVFFAVWQLVFHWIEVYWEVMPNYDWEVVHHGATEINAGPLMGAVPLHHVGFTPIDITVWIGLIGVLLVGIGRHLTGNLIPVKDPTLGMSLAHEQL
jgi:hypothetical protein